MPGRTASLKRITKETTIKVELNLDGTGRYQIRSGIRFLDHMLESLTKHGRFDLKLIAKGDLDVDNHHTNEDVGIVLGEAFRSALAAKRAIRRFADFQAPLDEALTQVRISLDISGRGGLYLHTHPGTKWLAHPALRARNMKSNYSLSDAKHLLDSLARHMGATIHIDFISGEDSHHVMESLFKALAIAMRQAVETVDDLDDIPSTKGSL